MLSELHEFQEENYVVKNSKASQLDLFCLAKELNQ